MKLKLKMNKPCRHKKTLVSFSACDKILECRCGKWIQYCNGGRMIRLEA